MAVSKALKGRPPQFTSTAAQGHRGTPGRSPRPGRSTGAGGASSGTALAASRLQPTAMESAGAVWYRLAGGLVGAAVLAVGVLGVIGQQGWRWPVAVAAAVTATVAVLLGRRAASRQQLVAQAAMAVAPLLGVRSGLTSPGEVLTARRWRGGLVGAPRRLVVSYPSTFDESDDQVLEAVTETLSRRLDADLLLRQVKPKKQRLVLTARNRKDEEAAAVEADKHPTFARAERTVKEFLGASATVTPTFAGEELTAVEVHYDQAVRVASEAWRRAAERNFSTMLPGRWRAHWWLEEDRATFELRPVLPRAVAHEPLPVTGDALHQLPYAVDEDGNVLTWDLKSLSPHFLVVGTTGSGKTVTLDGLIMEITRRGWSVYLVDPKVIEFLGLQGWPGVRTVATSIEEQIVVIMHVLQIMRDRYTAVKEDGADESDFEEVFLVLDEFKIFYKRVSDWWSRNKGRGQPSKCPVFDAVMEIATLGRSAKVRLVLGTQRPDAEWLTGDMRDNFNQRVSMGALSRDGAQMMWGAQHIGVALPRKVSGRATAMNAEGHPVEAQVFWTPDPRKAERHRALADLLVLSKLRPSEDLWAKHPRLRVSVPPIDPEDRDYATAWDCLQHARLVEVREEDLDGMPALLPAALDLEQAELDAVSLRKPVPDTAELSDDEPEDELVDEHAGFGELEEVRVRDLEPGDSVLVDMDGVQLWALVETAEPDIDDEDYVSVTYRTDDDLSMTMVAPESDFVSCRHPLEESADDDQTEQLETEQTEE